FLLLYSLSLQPFFSNLRFSKQIFGGIRLQKHNRY
ncbi:amino acid permease family protein, partial [Chlamydia psittaci 84-8471/1]